MSYRRHIRVHKFYVAALGRAVYNFAYLEWTMVLLGETLSPGFIDAAGRRTARQIAGRFKTLVDAVPSGDLDKARLTALAHAFCDLVKRRNGLVHGRPLTASKSKAGLAGSCSDAFDGLSQDDIIAAAKSFEIAAVEAQGLLHTATAHTTPTVNLSYSNVEPHLAGER